MLTKPLAQREFTEMKRKIMGEGSASKNPHLPRSVRISVEQERTNWKEYMKRIGLSQSSTKQRHHNLEKRSQCQEIMQRRARWKGNTSKEYRNY